MEQPFDYKQFVVLVVDDEEAMLRSFKREFGDRFRILTAARADEGLNLLKQHEDEVGVLIADSVMPGHKGTWLLEQARDIKPHLVRIYWSCCCVHEDALLEACKIGIHKFIMLPYDPPTMEQTLRGALEQFALVDEFVPKRMADKSSDRNGLRKPVPNRSPA
jgi:DNA-binding NtrC family response regulator